MPPVKFRYEGREFDIDGVDRQDHIYRFITTSRGFYELELLEYMRFVSRLDRRREPVTIDVGANIGNHSVFFGAFLGGRTISIEPNPRVLPILRRNLQVNVPDHAVFDCAVGRAEGTGRVVVPASGKANVGMARVEASTEPGDPGGVPITTLDTVLATYRNSQGTRAPVLLVKIDVEGAELDVLRGAPTILQEERPHVFVEAATPTHLGELAAHLEPLGYEPVTRWGWHATPVIHFAHRPPRWLRLSARAYQLASLPRYVRRAAARRVRARALS
jgi:FkbM family methyltransferase